LESGGLLSPIVLKQTGPESYEVLAGDLEYHAAARAKELDPRKGEMVSAYVVPPQNQAAAVAQVTPATPVKAEVVADDEPTLGDMLAEQKAGAGESSTIHAERMSKLSQLANSADGLPPGVTRKTAKEGFRKMQEALNSGDATVPKLLRDWERQNITPEQALWRVHSYGQGQDPYQPMPAPESTEPTSDWESKLNELKQVGSQQKASRKSKGKKR
jgi:hypothetical protein